MKKAITKKTQANKKCTCPFCEEELIEEGSPFCSACHKLINYCIRCKIAVQKGVVECPRCGGALV